MVLVYILVDKYIVLIVNFFNFCNLFVNFVFYLLRIFEFRKVLCLRERKKGKGKVVCFVVIIIVIYLYVVFK